MEEVVNYGILSLVPAILAVVLAFWTKNVVLSLIISLFTGALIIASWNPWIGMQDMFSNYLFVNITDSGNAQTIIMMSFVGGFVALLEKSGGARAFAQAIANKVRGKSTAQGCAWLSGDLLLRLGQQPDSGTYLPSYHGPPESFQSQAGLHTGLHFIACVHTRSYHRLGSLHHEYNSYRI